MTTMKRRMAMLVAVSAVSGVMTLFAPTTSAQAVPHEVCAGDGQATLSSGFYYPVGNALVSTTQPSSAHSATFAFHFNPPTGACAGVGGLTAISATGTVHGWCGFSVGSGTTSKGDDFHWTVGAGGTLIVTGEVEGAVNAVPNPAIANNTCTDHTGAEVFLINGSVVRQSCTVLNSPSHSVTTVTVGHDTFHERASVCA